MNRHTEIFVAAVRAGRVGGYARRTIFADAATAAGLAFDVAASIGAAPPSVAAGSDACDIARVLTAAERPLIITGTQHRDPVLLEAAFAVVDALNGRRETRPWLMLATAEANSLGSTMLEHGGGMSLSSLIEAIEGGDVTTLLVCENDLFERVGDHARLSRALDRLEHLIVFDHTATTTAARATHACPVATLAESSGTLINNEGRLQRFYQVLRSPEGIVPAWSLARDLLVEFSAGALANEWTHFEDITSALAAAEPRLSAAVDVAPPAGFRHQHQPVPRMSHRYSGRNATIQRDGLEDLATRGRTPEPVEPATVPRPASSDPETPFAFSMEGFSGRPPSALLARVWAPGWNSNEAINRFQIEVGGSLHGGDPGRRIFSSNGNTPSDAAAGRPNEPVRAGRPPSDAAEMNDPDATADALDRDVFLICAAAEIFGSESLSRRGPAIAQLAPPAYLILHPDRAAEIGLEAGQSRGVTLVGDDLEVNLELTIDTDPHLPAHVAVIPAGYPETLWWQAPLQMHLRPRDEAGS